ncbi:MAG: hypothetical protein ACKVOR_06250 [Flavobacteriales bacterium]
MNKPTQTGSLLINATFLLLGIYNILYWSGKFFGLLLTFYNGVKELWFWYMVLELMAVASLLVDTVIRWDQFSLIGKRLRIGLTACFTIAFVLRFIVGYMDLMLAGEVR